MACSWITVVIVADLIIDIRNGIKTDLRNILLLNEYVTLTLYVPTKFVIDSFLRIFFT
jgi:hypothetical protein